MPSLVFCRNLFLLVNFCFASFPVFAQTTYLGCPIGSSLYASCVNDMQDERGVRLLSFRGSIQVTGSRPLNLSFNEYTLMNNRFTHLIDGQAFIQKLNDPTKTIYARCPDDAPRYAYPEVDAFIEPPTLQGTTKHNIFVATLDPRHTWDEVPYATNGGQVCIHSQPPQKNGSKVISIPGTVLVCSRLERSFSGRSGWRKTGQSAYLACMYAISQLPSEAIPKPSYFGTYYLQPNAKPYCPNSLKTGAPMVVDPGTGACLEA